jgi:hypothetical protein
VASNDQCVKIISIENGSITALVDLFINLTRNRRIPPRSIVLIGSIFHLADDGLSAYIKDILEAAQKIKSTLGREVKVGPLLPMLLPGTGLPQVLREIF